MTNQPIPPQRPSSQPSSPQDSDSPRPHRSEQQWQDLISQQIEDAMRAGAFDNLPGKGKPLDLNKNPNTPPDMEIANKLLRDNDLSPGWIADRKEMLAKIETFRQRLAAEWELCNAETLPVRWADSLARFQTEIDTLNRQITTVNLGMAIPRLEIFRLILDSELKRIGASRQV